jgi:Transposase DDE domain
MSFDVPATPVEIVKVGHSALRNGTRNVPQELCGTAALHDANPQAMRQRRATVEHPFGTMKARMGATHFLTKTLPKVAAEMALSVLAYNLTRVMNIVGTKPLMAAIVA